MRLLTGGTRLWLLVLLLTTACRAPSSPEPLGRPVTYQSLVHADPGNWLAYAGTYDGWHYSQLYDIHRGNVGDLALAWRFPIDTVYNVEATPLVVDGVMFVTTPVNGIVALNATTGAKLWEFTRTDSTPDDILCCGRVNRGLAVLGRTLYMGTNDAHLVAVDARTGEQRWSTVVGDPALGYTISGAPLALKNEVLVGVTASQEGFGSEQDGAIPVRGFVDAYDATTGALKWRFHTVPAPGETGSESWSGESWRQGRSSAWVTGSFDPELNLIYWGIGDPAPAYDDRGRIGDNLYSCSVVALDADTGRLKWYYQFTPHDLHDFDATHTFVLRDVQIGGRRRRALLNANRNGFFYALDRVTGEFLLGRPFTKVTWAERIDAGGRPVLTEAGMVGTGIPVSPDADGGTSWWAPSFSPRTGLLYVTVHDGTETYQRKYVRGMNRLRDVPRSFVRAIAPETGDISWERAVPGGSTAGILTTAGNLLFSGTQTGDVFGLDVETGRPLWQDNVGGSVHASPVSYRSGGTQFVAVATSKAVLAFALPTPGQSMHPRWGTLLVAPGSRATTTSANPTHVRVEIEDLASDVPWGVQWNVERVAVEAGKAYLVRFRGRADRSRSVRVGVAHAQGDQSGLGLYQEVLLSTSWQDYDLMFRASATEGRARVHFDLGGDADSVELSDVQLVEASPSAPTSLWDQVLRRSRAR